MSIPKSITLADFPAALGFGRRDDSSLSILDGAVTVRYVCDLDGPDVVYEVSRGPHGWRMQEFFYGRKLGLAWNVQSFPVMFVSFCQMNYQGQQAAERHPRLRELMQHVTQERNIFFACPTKEGRVHFPEGLNFRLRLPVLESNRPAWETLRGQIDGQPGSLKFIRETPAFLLRRQASGQVERRPITVVDCAARLSDLAQAVDALWHGGAIAPGRENRLTIDDFTTAWNTPTAYLANAERGWAAFSIAAVSDGPIFIELAAALVGALGS